MQHENDCPHPPKKEAFPVLELELHRTESFFRCDLAVSLDPSGRLGVRQAMA